jgi:50S ribosomal subunit-associated GTPase HflX
VRSTLLEAGLSNRDINERVIEVWNKIDEVDKNDLNDKLESNPQVVPVSALTGDGIDNLKEVLQAVCERIAGQKRVRIEFPLTGMNDRMSMLRRLADVVYEDTLDCNESGETMSIECLIRPDALAKYNTQFQTVV